LARAGIGERAAVGQDDVLEQHRRPAGGQQARLDLGHLQHGRDRLGHPHQLALRLEDVDEFAKER
jgi:hypothetical protein